jgi:L-2,4-diaminobutyrate decarboxylase
MTDARTAALLAELEADMSFENGAMFTKIAADYFADTRKGEGPVSTLLDKATLAKRFAEPLPMGMKPLAEVAKRIETDIMPDVNRLMHPMYMGHQVSAPLAAAVWTEVVISAVNNSMAVWEMSPVATVIEEQVIRWMCDLAGLGPSASGTFTSGGTEATFTALLAARAAGAMGLGTDNCVSVSSTPEFKMDPVALASTLERLHKEGREVLAVVATAGCTAVGAFDDLNAVADLCDRYGHWLHVDGAHGASALLSEKHRWRVMGIHRARSMAWDPHKMMLMPLSAGMVLVRDGKDLERAFAQEAPYLFHGSESERQLSPDLGKRSIQCSRRAEVMKVWVGLQRLGSGAMGLLYDILCEKASEVHASVASQPGATPLHVPESNIVAWSLAGAGSDAVAATRRKLHDSDGVWITSTVIGGRSCLRATVMNFRSQRSSS